MMVVSGIRAGTGPDPKEKTEAVRHSPSVLSSHRPELSEFAGRLISVRKIFGKAAHDKSGCRSYLPNVICRFSSTGCSGGSSAHCS